MLMSHQRKGLTKLEQLENLPLSLDSLTLAGRFNSSLEGVTCRGLGGDDGPFYVSLENMGGFMSATWEIHTKIGIYSCSVQLHGFVILEIYPPLSTIYQLLSAIHIYLCRAFFGFWPFLKPQGLSHCVAAKKT